MTQRRIELSMWRARQARTHPVTMKTRKAAPRMASHLRDSFRIFVISKWSQSSKVTPECLEGVERKKEAVPRNGQVADIRGLYASLSRENYFGGKSSGWTGLAPEAATLKAASRERVT